MKFYTKSATLLSMSYGSTVARGVVTTFFMARWLPATTLGQFRYTLSIFGLASVFSIPGLGSAIIRGLGKGDTIIIRTAIRRVMKFSPIGSVAILIAAALKLHQGESDVALAIAIGAPLFPFFSLAPLYESVLTGKQEIRRLAQTNIIVNLIFSVLMLGILFRIKTVAIVFFSYITIDTALRCALLYRETKRTEMKGSSDLHIQLSNHLTFIYIAQIIAHQIDQVLIQYFFGYKSVADYYVATLIPEQIKNFTKSMGGIILRRFSQYKRSSAILAQARRHYWNSFIISAVPILLYVVSAPFLIRVFFPQYTNEILPSILYSLSVFTLPTMVGTSFFQAHQEIRFLWKFYNINSFLQITANVLLIPFFGGIGAIASKVLSRILSIGFAYPRLSRQKGETETYT